MGEGLDDAELATGLGEGGDGAIQLLFCMGGGELGADAGLLLGYYGVEEAHGVYAELEQAVAEALRQGGVSQHDGYDGVAGTGELEAALLHALAEVGCVVLYALGELGGGLEHVDYLDGGGGDGGHDAVGEQVGAGLLAQHVYHLLTGGYVAAGGAAEGLAEGAGGDVYLAEQAAMLVRATAAGAEYACGVGFVEVYEGAVLLSQLVDFVQAGNDAVHGEHAVCGDEDGAGAVGLGLLQLGLEVCHVVVGIAVTGGLAKAHAVDDGGVVEGVGDDGVFLGQEGLEQAAVGIKAGAEEDGVLHTEEGAEALLELLVQGLRAADEAHGGHTEAPAVDGILGCLFQLGVVGKAKVVIGAHVDDLAAIMQAHLRVLRCGNVALLLVQTCLLQRGKVRNQSVFEICIVHNGLYPFNGRDIVVPPTPFVNLFAV